MSEQQNQSETYQGRMPSQVIQYGMARPHMVNVPELKKGAAEAIRDPLTNLLNRRGFGLALERMRQYSIRDGKPMGHGFLDMDHFKQVNDTLGHNTADRLLCMVADRFSKLIRQVDAAGRTGGDEFEFGFHNLATLEDAQAIQNKFTEAFTEPIMLGNEKNKKEYYPKFSTGLIYGCEGDKDTIEHQTKMSDGLMRLLKASRDEDENNHDQKTIFQYALADREGIIHQSSVSHFVGQSIESLAGHYGIQV